MKPLGRTAPAFLTAVILVTMAGSAAAQPAPSDVALAESLFREGRQLINAGKTSEACGKFAESERLDPQIGTELNLALCHEKEGKTASAWGEFNDVAQQATLPADKDRGEFARRHASDIEKKLSRVRLTVAGA